MEQCGWNSVVEQFCWNSGRVMLEQCTWNIDGGILRCNSVGERVWWNSVGGTKLVEHYGGTVEQCWWNSVVEQWNSVGGTVW